MRAPSDVEAYRKGASPFGVLDMVGNVSQWTDEFRDDHTRAALRISFPRRRYLNRAAPCGISRRPTVSMSTRNFF